MEKSLVYCTKKNCPVLDCPRNNKHVVDGQPASFAHLEDNPLYCKKPNWHGNQVDMVRVKRDGVTYTYMLNCEGCPYYYGEIDACMYGEEGIPCDKPRKCEKEETK